MSRFMPNSTGLKKDFTLSMYTTSVLFFQLILTIYYIKGNLTSGCMTAGEHYNPTGKTHGGPQDANRHVGDLGNLMADSNGKAYLKWEDHLMQIYGGVNNIVGRSMVVHEREDDLGAGGNEESLKTGNSGPRLACGVIGLSGPFAHM